MKSGYEKGNTMMEIKKYRKKEERNILCLIFFFKTSLLKYNCFTMVC